MDNTSITERPRFPVGKLAIGLVLIGVGLATFFDSIDVWEIGMLWRYWPLILIAIGLANAYEAFRRRQGDGSYFLLGVGVWMLAGSFNLFGLTYASAFPLGIIVVGFGAVVHAIIDVPPAAKENGHERQ
jgi:cell wall-active antibiotic response 4TMS protein YvqF